MISSMFKIGEIRNRGKYKQIWQSCAGCGKQRWVKLNKGNPQSIRCHSCSAKLQGKDLRMEKNPCWRGGKIKDAYGYSCIRVSVDNPFYPMANRGYISEHRLLMAKYLNRLLKTEEIVHHLNGIKDDNRMENLVLVSRRGHSKWTYIRTLQERIRNLESGRIK